MMPDIDINKDGIMHRDSRFATLSKGDLISALKNSETLNYIDLTSVNPKDIDLCIILEILGNRKEVDAIEPIFKVITEAKNYSYIEKCAVKALASMGSEIILDPIKKKLDSEDQDVRKVAVMVIGELAKSGDLKSKQELERIMNNGNESREIRGTARSLLLEVNKNEKTKKF